MNRNMTTSDLARVIFQRVLEQEMLRLIEAARSHGFRLEIEGEDMNCRAVDTSLTSKQKPSMPAHTPRPGQRDET
jgi:hypothetical protein